MPQGSKLRRARREDSPATTAEVSVANGAIEASIEALTAMLSREELAAFVRSTLARLSPEARQERLGVLVEIAASRGTSLESSIGTECPHDQIVARAREFFASVRDTGEAAPPDIDAWFESAASAFYEGDFALARALYATLLSEITRGGFALSDVGEEDSLRVDFALEATRYLVAVYETTHKKTRVSEVQRAHQSIADVANVPDPLEAMPRVARRPLIDFYDFSRAWKELCIASRKPLGKRKYR